MATSLYCVEKVFIDVYVDNWAEGEKEHCNYFELEGCNARTLDELFKKLEVIIDVEKQHWNLNSCDEQGRVTANRLVDVCNETPSEKQLAEFKRGERDLFSQHIDFSIVLKTTTPVCLLGEKGE